MNYLPIALLLALSPALAAQAEDAGDDAPLTINGCVIADKAQEGAAVFWWQGSYWMLVDRWQGMGVLRSSDLATWTEQPGTILGVPGRRPDDGDIGRHGEVVVQGHEAYLFYFTHPAGPELELHAIAAPQGLFERCGAEGGGCGRELREDVVQVGHGGETRGLGRAPMHLRPGEGQDLVGTRGRSFWRGTPRCLPVPAARRSEDLWRHGPGHAVLLGSASRPARSPPLPALLGHCRHSATAGSTCNTPRSTRDRTTGSTTVTTWSRPTVR